MCEPSHGQRVLAKVPQGSAQQALHIVSTGKYVPDKGQPYDR